MLPEAGTNGDIGRLTDMCIEKAVSTGLVEAEISCHEQVAEELWRMVLSTSGWIGPDPEPGQFLMLRVSEGSDPLLARPFGIAGFERNGSIHLLEIIFRVVGRGTAAMSGWKKGHRVQFLGPLGKSFRLPPEGSRSLLVAGGIGLPPLLSLARRMDLMERAGELTLLYGEASRSRFLDLDARIFPGIEVLTCTEDGSCGNKGLVTDLLREKTAGEDHHLYVCGPNAMMKAVRGLTGDRCLSAQYSLEARMACGFGVCAGCAVLTRTSGVLSYVRVCREGPVFDGKELIDESFGEI
jgi:dihydroorotate dehydrogenase electron transfer subunit